MAWHNTPRINFKSFLLLAMLPAFYYLILVLIPGEKIYPVYTCEADKINSVAVPKFIFTAHHLKLENPYKFSILLLFGLPSNAAAVYYLAKLITSKLLGLFVVRHKHANALSQTRHACANLGENMRV